MNSTERYLTVAEAAAFLNTSERFVRRLVSERRVAFHHVGRHVRFAVSDLDVFVQAGRVDRARRKVVSAGHGRVSGRCRRPRTVSSRSASLRIFRMVAAMRV